MVIKNYQKLPKVNFFLILFTKSYQKLPTFTKSYQKLPKVTKSYHVLPNVSQGKTSQGRMSPYFSGQNVSPNLARAKRLSKMAPRAECHPGQNVSGQNVTQPICAHSSTSLQVHSLLDSLAPHSCQTSPTCE